MFCYKRPPLLAPPVISAHLKPPKKHLRPGRLLEDLPYTKSKLRLVSVTSKNLVSLTIAKAIKFIVYSQP